MHASGHTTVWGTHRGIGRASDTKSWYQQLQTWWTAHKAARWEATLASLRACWDAKHEAWTPRRAEAACDIAAAQGVFPTATYMYGLTF